MHKKQQKVLALCISWRLELARTLNSPIHAALLKQTSWRVRRTGARCRRRRCGRDQVAAIVVNGGRAIRRLDAPRSMPVAIFGTMEI